MARAADPTRGRVLVVEDEAVIAMELRRLVADAGFRALGPAGTLERAHELLAVTSPDLAVLDVNLKGRSIAPLAQTLKNGAVPFLLLTGYDVTKLDAPVLRAAPWLKKPPDARRLAAWLARSMPPSPKP